MIALSYIPLCLLVVLIFVLARRKAYLSLPFFCSYVAFAVCSDLARFVVRETPGAYFTTYWATEAGYGILGILVIYEVLRATFGDILRVRWVRLVLPVVVALSILLSAARNQHNAEQLGGQLMLYIFIGETAVRFVQVLVFVGLTSLVPLLGLRWRQYPFGIATGFGLYATVALLTTTKFSDFGTRFGFLWSVSLLVSYSIAVLIWLWFFSAAEKPAKGSPAHLPPSPEVLDQYKQALRRVR